MSPSTLVMLIVGAFETAGCFRIASSSTYFVDDYFNFALARIMGFTQYLGKDAYGLFVPGAKLVDEGLSLGHPIPRAPAVVIETMLFATFLFVLYRLLVLLFGRSWGVVALTALAGSSQLLLTAVQWWSAALNLLPFLVTALLALDGLIRHAVTGKRRHLVVSVTAYALGLEFYDPSILTLGILVLFAFFFLGRAPTVLGGLRALTTRWALWIAYLVPTAFVLVWRFSHPEMFGLGKVAGPTLIARWVGVSWGQAFVPGTLGIWYPVISSGLLKVLCVVLGQFLVLALIVTSVRRWSPAWRAWAFFAISFCAMSGLAAFGRAAPSGSTQAAFQSVYLVLDPALLALTLGLAFLPLRVPLALGSRRESSAPRRRGRHVSVSSRPVRAIALLATLAVGVPAVLTWRSQPLMPYSAIEAQSRAFVDRATPEWSHIAQGDSRAFLWDEQIPFRAMALNGFPFDLPSNSVGMLLTPPPRYNQATGHGYLLDGRGQVVAARPQVVAPDLVRPGGVMAGNGTVTASVQGTCVHTGGSGTAAETQLRSPLSKSQWWMRLRYTSSRSYANLVPGSAPPVTVNRGLHDVVIPLGSQPLSHVVMFVPARTSLCLIKADVEHPVPKTELPA